MAIAADSWRAVGIVSFELWQRLTSSFGWTVRPPPSRLGGEVRDDLVHVRIGRGARAGLVDVDRELVVVGAVGDRRRRGARWPRDVRLEQAELAVGLGRGELDQGQRVEEPRAGSGWPEIGKLRTARWVEAPYSASAGTAISPIESRSIARRGVRGRSSWADCRSARRCVTPASPCVPCGSIGRDADRSERQRARDRLRRRRRRAAADRRCTAPRRTGPAPTSGAAAAPGERVPRLSAPDARGTARRAGTRPDGFAAAGLVDDVAAFADALGLDDVPPRRVLDGRR